MAISKIDIANMALGRAGVQGIASFTEESEPAAAVGLFFDRARRKILRSHPWNFATEAKALAVTTEEPVGWDYQYGLPADALRPLYIYNSAASNPNDDSIKFEVRGPYLLTNEEDATLVYVKDVTDPNKYDESFIDAFAYQLAADIIVYLSGDRAMSQTLLQMAAFAVQSAAAVDANVGRNPRYDGSTFIDARD